MKSRIKALGLRIDSVGPTVLKKLALTDKLMCEIARETGLHEQTVFKINKRYGIRPYEETIDIMAKTSSVRQTGSKRKKVNHFNIKQKNDLLEQHKGIIIKMARTWWNSTAIKTKFIGDKDIFIEKINRFVFEQLDYYNPKVKGKTGKTAKPSTWMFKAAKIACMRLYSRASKEAKKKQMPVNTKGQSIAQTGIVETTRQKRKNVGPATIQWIPFSAKSILKALDLELDSIAEIGFGNIKKQIIEIARKKKTGLSKREKKIIEMSLNGESTEKIGKILKIEYENVNSINLNAAKKIRLDLEGKQWVPISAQKLIKKLGLDPKYLAKTQFTNIKRVINIISRKKETGLTKMEQRVIKMRLDGKNWAEIANAIKRPGKDVTYFEKTAVKKIRSEIKRRRLQK